MVAVPASHTVAKRAWSLRDRLDERTRVDVIDAYRAGATAASLASAHGLSLRSIKPWLPLQGFAASNCRDDGRTRAVGCPPVPRQPGVRLASGQGMGPCRSTSLPSVSG